MLEQFLKKLNNKVKIYSLYLKKVFSLASIHTTLEKNDKDFELGKKFEFYFMINT